MAEQNENEYVKDVEVEITGIEKVLTQDHKAIAQFRFSTTKGVVTWKPKIPKEEYQDGIKETKSILMPKDDIPEKIKEMGKKIASDGKVKAKISYSIFAKEVDGEEQEYRFIRGRKTFDEWELL